MEVRAYIEPFVVRAIAICETVNETSYYDEAVEIKEAVKASPKPF